MSHSLLPPSATIPTPFSTTTTHKQCPLPVLGFGRQGGDSRRVFIYGLVGVGLVPSICCENANAASRRPPPPPPTEKKDPNVSGVQAKVLASIKRKEAMKDAIVKLREKGKPVK